MNSKDYAEKVDNWSSTSEQLVETRDIMVWAQAESKVSMLDFGCGSGRALQEGENFGIRHLVGVDMNPFLLDMAVQRTRFAVYYEDLQDVIFEDHSFDFIFVSHTISHVFSLLSTLKALRLLLQHDGTLLLVIPNELYRWLMTPKNVRTNYRDDPTMRWFLWNWQWHVVFRRAGFKMRRQSFWGEKPLSWMPDNTRSRVVFELGK